MIQRCIHIIDAITGTLGRVVSWFALAMMALTCVVVVLRYGFGIGAIPLQEAVMYLHGALFMLAIPWALRVDAHVRVDVLYGRFNARRKALVNLLGHLLFLLPIAAFIVWVSWDYTLLSWRIREGSAEANGIDAVFLLKSLTPALGALLFLQGLAEIARCTLILLGRMEPESAPDAGPAA